MAKPATTYPPPWTTSDFDEHGDDSAGDGQQGQDQGGQGQ
jgi:hypothetical protein